MPIWTPFPSFMKLSCFKIAQTNLYYQLRYDVPLNKIVFLLGFVCTTVADSILHESLHIFKQENLLMFCRLNATNNETVQKHIQRLSFANAMSI
jgi:hypothetical protein